MIEYLISRLLVCRTNEKTGTIYTAFSEDNSHAFDVEFAFLESSWCWQLRFINSLDETTALMIQDKLDFTLLSSNETIKATITEARFSVAGKSEVKDENHSLIGCVRDGLGKIVFVSPDKTEIGTAVWKRKLQKFLPPDQNEQFSHGHLIEAAVGHSIDYRLVYCFIGRLVAGEWQSTGS